MERLVQPENIEEVVERLLSLRAGQIDTSDVQPFRAEALLGGGLLPEKWSII
jgi:hypothetical protein